MPKEGGGIFAAALLIPHRQGQAKLSAAARSGVHVAIDCLGRLC